MLKVLLDCNDHPAVFDLPHNPLEIGNYLLAAGHWGPYADLSLTDSDDPDQVQVKLIPETAADVYLQSLFPKDARLSAVNTVCDLFYHLPTKNQESLVEDIAAGKIIELRQLLDGIKSNTHQPQTAAPYTMHFYCPLTVSIESGDGRDYIEVENGALGDHEDEIRDTIENFTQSRKKALFEYFYGTADVKAKLLSIRFDVENVRNEIFGCVHVNMTEPPTEEEKEELREWIESQVSDGWGVGFWERRLETPDGDLHISFWDNGDDWFLLDDDEFEQHIGQYQPEKESPAQSIVFSRVKLWTDTGEECEFYTEGAPVCYEDIEDHEDCIDFKEFLEQTPGASMEGITAFVTTFSESDSEPQSAEGFDIERIYRVIADVDIDTITGWNWIGQSQFTFDYDVGELFGMNGIE